MEKRRTFTSEFKSKVALEALREQQSIHLPNAIKFTLHRSQNGRSPFWGKASTVFDKGKTHTAQEAHNKR